MTFRPKRGIEDFGWGGWDRVGESVVPGDATLVVNGTKRKDFIHSFDDGLVAPKGYNDLPVLQNGVETIYGGGGNDIIRAGRKDQVHGGAGTDILYGSHFQVDRLAEIDGLAEEMHVKGGGTLLLRADGGICDLTKCYMPGIYALELTSIDFVKIDVTLSLNQLSDLRQLRSYHELNSVDGIVRVIDSGYFSMPDLSSMYDVELHAAAGDDNWSLTSALYKVSLFLEGGNDHLYVDYQSYCIFDGGDGDDVLICTNGDSRLLGGVGDDHLTSGDFKYSLYGGDGNDVLLAGIGGDSLTGGAGADVFLYLRTTESRNTRDHYDIVADFSRSEGDEIDLSAVDADITKCGDQAFHLGGSAFTHIAGEIIQVDHGSYLSLLMDVDGDAQGDMSIQLNSVVALIATDFIL